MNKGLFALFIVIGIFIGTGTASATVFYIDEFTITENGQTYWQDTFSDGITPADQAPANVDVNRYNRVYLTRPLPRLPGPESGGKLAMDTDEGFLNTGTANPVLNRVQRGRVNSAINSSFNSSLTASDAIHVSGLFDLIEPQQNGELYSVRLTDWFQSDANEGLELAVRKTLAGDWVVQYRQAVIGAEWDPLQTWALGGIANLADYEQISLSLFNDPVGEGGGVFSAEFTLFDTDGNTMDMTYQSNVFGLMFQESDWLRADFTARVRVAAVPEPHTFMLVGLGLLVLLVPRKFIRA